MNKRTAHTKPAPKQKKSQGHPLRHSDLAEIRRAVANYISSEGCSCCEASNHKQHKEELAKLLHVRKYSDGSGYDFNRHRLVK